QLIKSIHKFKNLEELQISTSVKFSPSHIKQLEKHRRLKYVTIIHGPLLNARSRIQESRLESTVGMNITLLTPPFLVYSKGGGGDGPSSSSGSYGGSSSSSSNSYTSSLWVFWYYDDGGIILCGIWRCYMIRKFYRDDRIYNTTEYETAFDAFASEHEIPTNNRSRNQSELQYPPLNDPPPAYDTAYGAERHLHGLRHNANFEAYKAGRQFTRDNPPHEILPPREHIMNIILNGGPKAWKMVIFDHNANDLVSVSDRGRTVTFHGKNDIMVQANYPLFRPQLNNDDSSQLNSIIVNSTISNNIPPPSDLPPNYEQ
ncbi:25556_t:CDS:2, partial [Racocetra persica]